MTGSTVHRLWSPGRVALKQRSNTTATLTQNLKKNPCLTFEKAVQKLLENIAWPNDKSKKEIHVQVSYLFSIL